MMTTTSVDDRNRLTKIARDAMLERQLEPDFSQRIASELKKLPGPNRSSSTPTRDLRGLVWCSIDNDDSEDLDQITFSELAPEAGIKLMVAIADVDERVPKGSAIDEHAWQNTTSIYTSAAVFPMLPNELSSNLTSLRSGETRSAVVVEMRVADDGAISDYDIYRAIVENKAKLTYHRVGAWLEGKTELPEEIARVRGLSENLRLQDRCAQILGTVRHEHGSLDLETIQSRPIFSQNDLQAMATEHPDRAKQLIENFMIAANQATSLYLKKRGLPSFRRIVRTPKNWERIVEVAAQHGTTLPHEPDSVALAKFVQKEKLKDPTRFPDLSLTIVKLLGKGEYVVEAPGEKSIGHFGLAVRDYTHSTAPNRRYPDLITQRILKAAINGTASPYTIAELTQLAQRCTEQEDAADKVERKVHKATAALLLSHKIGQVFEGICTGSSEKGTWVRIFNPPVEGKLVRGFEGMKVGHRLHVRLVAADVEKGFIDFVQE